MTPTTPCSFSLTNLSAHLLYLGLSAQEHLAPVAVHAAFQQVHALISDIILTSMFSACMQAHEERCAGAAGLSALEGLAALLKRLFILHSSKLMALAVFWAAMQQPGAIGWLLTCKPIFSCHTLQLTPSSLLVFLYNCWALTGLSPVLTFDAVGLVVLSPLLGRSATAPKHQQRLMLLAMVILDAITGIWMLLQYAYEVCTNHSCLRAHQSCL